MFSHGGNVLWWYSSPDVPLHDDELAGGGGGCIIHERGLSWLIRLSSSHQCFVLFIMNKAVHKFKIVAFQPLQLYPCVYLFLKYIKLLESPIPPTAATPSQKAHFDNISRTKRGTIDPLVSKRPEKNSE